MTLAQLFKKFRDKRGYSQTELANIISQMPNCKAFSAQSYAAIESGKTQRTGFLLEIAKALDIPLEILANLPTEDELTTHNPQISCWQIPIIKYQDVPNYHKDNNSHITYELIDKTKSSAHTFGVIVEGVAMSPEFNQNDVALIDPNIEPTSNDYVLVKLNETIAIRQLQKEGKTIYLLTTNPLFPQPVTELTNQISIYGTVIRKIKYYKTEKT